MNGVHDLGGTDGLGPVIVPDSEPVFTAEWEKAAFAMFSMCFRAGFFGVDEFRCGIEQMHPAVYLLSPYYEHWIHTVEHYGKAKGLLDLDEVDRRTQYYLEHPDTPLPQRDDPDLVAFVEAVVPAGAPANRESDKAPQFKVGDTVTVRADSPTGHTRRARYMLSLIESIRQWERSGRDPEDEPWSYYEHWLTALETVLAGSGLLSESMLDERTNRCWPPRGTPTTSTPTPSLSR